MRDYHSLGHMIVSLTTSSYTSILPHHVVSKVLGNHDRMRVVYNAIDRLLLDEIDKANPSLSILVLS